MTRLVIVNVTLPEGIRDVAITDGVITEIAEELHPAGSDVVDGRGGALIPGLHDHHLHLHALAAATSSVRCGPPQVTSAAELATALAAAPTAGDAGWVRGFGYVETVAGMLDRTSLDRLHDRRPVRLQHRSGAVWFFNSAAAAIVNLSSGDHPGIERDALGAPTGRVWRADTWLRERIGGAGPPGLAAVGAELAQFGITGVTDATPDLPDDSLAHLLAEHANGALPQGLHLLGVEPEVTGSAPTVTVGPCKIVLADSDLPDFPTLCRQIRKIREHRRGVAVHCVTRESLLLLLAALDEVGAHPDDRIEHGAIVAEETALELSRRAIPVVTQPGFIADRGDDYLDRLDAHDVHDLYRCRTLMESGVAVALSSDAPYGPTDPWSVIAAAATRVAPDGRIVGAAERIDRRAALRMYLAPLSHPQSPPRTVAVGRPADLVVLAGSLDRALTIGSDAVRCTIIRGRVIYHG
ncbi:amidohydrolase family protein [Gordonia sp. KTR9]|uniref:amidohydrolase family protein n=1 Tax=Gordonia sp. KTR9 TaxID=337191 RepID=UPI0002D2E26C|nr:amidohydrolase family protein [Gordonia sp. KTR9]